jgi:hypothetical protein
MAGLVPAIHVTAMCICAESVDARHKAGHDEGPDHVSVRLHAADVEELDDDDDQQHREYGE